MTQEQGGPNRYARCPSKKLTTWKQRMPCGHDGRDCNDAAEARDYQVLLVTPEATKEEGSSPGSCRGIMAPLTTWFQTSVSRTVGPPALIIWNHPAWGTLLCSPGKYRKSLWWRTECVDRKIRGERGSPVQDQVEGQTECDAVRGAEEAGVLDRRPHRRATAVLMRDRPWEALVSTRLPGKVGACVFLFFVLIYLKG